MKWTGLNEIRRMFLDFYEEKGHKILPSYPLVPQGDNSLLLINSGMAPMKKYFLGQEKPESVRIATCQKCIRTPDIERVGKTSRHGTFFEMLGNFSFGDYFKVEAIEFAWEFVKDIVQLPLEKIWISIYLDDDEAFKIWRDIICFPEERIVRLGKADNFWEIGSGPCGPCSEIYFDRGENSGCNSPSCAVGCDCDRYVEFWNLVFSQYNSDGEGNYSLMEKPNIDTGMGLERLACILQGVNNLFEVDTIKIIIENICLIAGVVYKQDEKKDVSLRVITDHIRGSVFMISDGVLPSNEGRGYVLRRLLRRAIRHGKLLGIKGQFLEKVVGTLVEKNQDGYPELRDRFDYIIKVINNEEEVFLKTLDKGIEKLSELMKTEVRDGVFSGEGCFLMYDTFGFPIDLIEEIGDEKGIILDKKRFDELMKGQKQKARDARKKSNNIGWDEGELNLDQFPKTEFIGYKKTMLEGKVLGIIKNNSLEQDANVGEQVVLIFDRTVFYGESGGQVGDRGFIASKQGTARVLDCKKSSSGIYLHRCLMEKGKIEVGEKVSENLEKVIRNKITRNHTAAHLLQSALQKVLGNHVLQAGQLVDEDRIRFDFSHFSGMTIEEIKETEKIVNSYITEGILVDIEEMDIKKAREKGAMAIFGEKYGNIVRVVDVGGRSIELCGGSHVENTNEIGVFKILSETSVASGVRRIEAITGMAVLEILNSIEEDMAKIGRELKLKNSKDIPQKVIQINKQLKEKTKEVEEYNQKTIFQKINDKFDQIVASSLVIDGVCIIAQKLGKIDTKVLKLFIDKIKDKQKNSLVILLTSDKEKGTVAVGASKFAIEKGYNSGKVVKNICEKLDGKGGGRADSAIGGFSKISDIDKVLKDISKFI